MNENYIPKIEELEKYLHKDDKISMIFLLYNDEKLALQCSSLCLTSTSTTPLLDWALKHGGDQTKDWNKKFFEALAITENYLALNKLFGIKKEQADNQYLPKNEYTSLSVLPLRKQLYLICEQLSDEESSKLICYMLKNCTNKEEKYNSTHLELYLLDWLENQVISKYNLSRLVQALKLIERQDLATSLDIVKQKEKEIASSSSEFQDYKLDPNNMGLCIIINQKNFRSFDNRSALSTRVGTDVDRDKLQETFLMFGYTCKIHENLKSQELFLALKEASMKIKATDSSLVVCILSHGVKDGVACSDGKYIGITAIESIFTPDVCPALAGKPKVFIIQACQGEDYQRVVNYEVPPEVDSNLATDSPNSLTPQVQSVAEKIDILKCHATVSGYVAFRDEITGSPYIRLMCLNLMKHSQQKDLASILVQVNSSTSSTVLVKDNQRFTASPVFNNSLRKSIRFQYNEEGVAESTRKRLFRAMLNQLLQEFLQDYCFNRNNLS